MKKFILYSIFSLLAIAIVTIGGFGYYSLTEDHLTEAPEKMLRTIQKGDLPRAYYLYTTDSYQESRSLDEFKQWVKDRPILMEFEMIYFYGQKIDGEEGTLMGALQTSHSDDIPLKFRLQKEYGEWKVAELKLSDGGYRVNAIAVEEEETPNQTDEERIEEVVLTQLEAFKNEKYAKAYSHFLSAEFKNAITYDQFKDAIASYPEFREYESATIDEIDDDHDLKKVTVIIIHNGIPNILEYWLAKEEGEWKIWAIEFNANEKNGELALNDETEQDAPHSLSNEETKKIEEVIESQLTDIKEGDLEKAYNDFASPEFKKATSLEQFNDFVKNYPEFTEYKDVSVEETFQSNGLTLVKVLLQTDKGESEVEYWITQKNGTDEIFGIRVVKSAYYPPISEKEKQEIVSVIKQQLDELKKDDLSKAYYAFVSQEFENNTSLDGFKEFLDDYPIFIEQDNVTIGNGIEEGDIRLIRVALHSEQETAEVDYRLIKQDGEWKIWGIQILTNEQDTPSDDDDIKQIVEDQINALKVDDFSKAYYAYTSKQFQEVASESTFENYIKKHPGFSENESILFEIINFKPNLSLAVVTLVSSDGESESFQYQFVFENNKWRIQSIKFLPDGPLNARNGALEITNAKIGTEINLQGFVTNPATIFKPDDKQITVNVFVKEAEKGDTIQAILEHVPSRSTIPPVNAKIDVDGSTVINYVFTSPTQGWPEGTYKLTVSSPKGEEKTFEFQVKK